MPSAKYSWAGSLERFSRGRTARERMVVDSGTCVGGDTNPQANLLILGIALRDSSISRSAKAATPRTANLRDLGGERSVCGSSAGSGVAAGAGGATRVTGAINRYPRRGTV